MNKIKIIYAFARSAGYNEEVKQQYKILVMKFLQNLAKDLQLKKGEYKIRFNAGGIAVSGNAILHHQKFYVAFGDSNSIYFNLTGMIVSVATTPLGRYYSVKVKDHQIVVWFDSTDISLQ